MLFKDGSREPLHGHNYRVQIKGNALELDDDMVFNFLDIKPIVREICNELDHKLLIPKINVNLRIEENQKNYKIITRDESEFSFPKSDVLLLPIENTSVERIAHYIALKISELVKNRFQFEFRDLEVEVEESPGQSATFSIKK
jgi:6-pyruvoyltetrahydropterin/6-carboxytetrahydropterin synthase